MAPPDAVTDQAGALRATYEWFERNSGWAPPDHETLGDWVAEGLSRCPDDCIVAFDRWCDHGLASWWLVRRDLGEVPAVPAPPGHSP